jgi:hypothetical protein
MALPRRRDAAAPTAPVPRKRYGRLIALGALAVLAFALSTLPAALLGRFLPRAGLEAALSGSLWRGEARALAWRSVPLGDLTWTIVPGALLRGRLGGTITLARPDGRLQSAFGVTPGGELRLADAQFEWPVEALAMLPVGMPRGWRGRLSGRFDEIVVRGGWPTRLSGSLDMDDLVAPPPRGVSIGSYHVVIPDPQAGAAVAGALTARVSDKGGPFAFEGRFTLGQDRSFLLEGTLAPRGSTPPALARSLELLGPADASGRRPVSVSGTL